MKKLLFIIGISLIFNAQSQESWSFQRDKQLHAGVGAAMGAGLTQLMLSSNLGYDRIDVLIAPVIPISFVAGFKEFLDATVLDGDASGADIAYTMIGGVVGSFVTYSINDRLNNRKRKDKLKL